MDIDYNEKDWATPCPKYDCRKTACKCGLEYVNIPTSLGDDSEGSNVAPKNGAYCNALVFYEANGHVYIYTKEGIPTLIDVDASDISTLEQEVRKAQKDVYELREDIDRFAYFFDTVSDMQAFTGFKSGDYAKTLGFHSLNDGGGAYYRISNSGTVNGMDVLSLSGSLLKATLIVEDEVNVKQLGAYGDNLHNDSNYINRALSLSPIVFIPAGTFLVENTINLGARKIYGAGQFQTFIKPSSNLSPVINVISNFAMIDNLCLRTDDYDYDTPGTSNTQTAIDIVRFHYASISNTRIVGFNVGVYCYRAWVLNFFNDMFICCNTGIHGEEEFNNVMIEKCLINTNLCGLYVSQGFSIDIESCCFERNTKGSVVRNLSEATFNGCYFEGNTECSVHIVWGQQSVRSVKITNSSFYCGSLTQALIKYHMVQTGYIIVENCVMRNNTDLSPGTTPIFVRTNDTLVVPHLIGCEIGESFALGAKCYVDKLHSEFVTGSDIFDMKTGYDLLDSHMFVDNNHIYGSAIISNENGIPNTNTIVATFKTGYSPKYVQYGFGALTSNQYDQTTNNLCNFYINPATGLTLKGDGSSTMAKINFDYIM